MVVNTGDLAAELCDRLDALEYDERAFAVLRPHSAAVGDIDTVRVKYLGIAHDEQSLPQPLNSSADIGINFTASFFLEDPGPIVRDRDIAAFVLEDFLSTLRLGLVGKRFSSDTDQVGGAGAFGNDRQGLDIALHGSTYSPAFDPGDEGNDNARSGVLQLTGTARPLPTG